MSKEFDERVTNFFKNYQDRGMKKWGVFFLSDHTATLKKDRQQRARAMTYPKKSEMKIEEISSILFKAFSDHYQVSVQLKTRNEEKKVFEEVFFSNEESSKKFEIIRRDSKKERTR